jgi:acyl-CoA synthetase (AMP-forming)/AMP-acid ligase II
MSNVFTSRYDDVAIPDVGIHEFVYADAGDHPDRMAVIDGPSGRSYTYGQLLGMVRSFAGGLSARGFGKGDVLAIIAPNIPEYAVVFHGTCMTGGAVTTVNPTYGAEEIAYQLRDAKASYAVTIGMFLPTVQEAAEQAGVEHVFTFDAVDGCSVTRSRARSSSTPPRISPSSPTPAARRACPRASCSPTATSWRTSCRPRPGRTSATTRSSSPSCPSSTSTACRSS